MLTRRHGQVIHNPGARPARLPQHACPTVTVVREDSAARFATTDIAWIDETSSNDRGAYAVILHDVPQESMAEIVESLRNRVDFLCLTETYTALGPLLSGLCKLVSAT